MKYVLYVIFAFDLLSAAALSYLDYSGWDVADRIRHNSLRVLVEISALAVLSELSKREARRHG